MEKNYFVTNLIGGTVFYIVPGETRERTWKGKDSKQRVPFEELENCVYDPEVKALFERGYLYIDDKSCRIELGLESGDPEVQTGLKTILTQKELESLLYTKAYKEFESQLANLADGSIELLIQLAVSSTKQISIDKSDYIRKNFHVDLETLHRARREEEKAKEG